MGAEVGKVFSLKPGNFCSELKIRLDARPERLQLRSRKPFKIVLHHQKGFQLIPIVLGHAHEVRAKA